MLSCGTMPYYCKNIFGPRDELGALADERMRTPEIRMRDGPGDDEDVAILFEREPRGRERTGTFRRFNDKDAFREAAYDAVAFEKTVRVAPACPADIRK